MISRYEWAAFKTSDFTDIDPMHTIAVLPTAAIEQHGPHLPLGVDTMIAQEMLATVCDHIPTDMDVRILPVQAVGKSNEHCDSPGTLTLSAQTALTAWTEIGLSIAKTGIRKLVIVNSHGGNLNVISILARELRVQAGMLAVTCQWGAFGTPDGLFSEHELTHGLHGGDVETSLMLAFQPDLVDMDKAADFRSSAENAGISPTGPISAGWIARDLNPNGVVGEAHLATAEKGHATAQHQAAGFISLLQDVLNADLPT